MRKPALFMLLILLWACHAEQKQARADIEKQEALLASAEGGGPALDALSQHYQAYAAAYPEDEAHAPAYLYRAAGLMFRQEAYSECLAPLRQLLQRYPGSSAAPKALEMAASVYAIELRDSATAVFLQACGQKVYGLEAPMAESPEEQLLELKGKVFDDSLMQVDFRLADRYIRQAGWYTAICKDEDDGPGILFSAAEIARSVRAYEKAAALLQDYAALYPEGPAAAQALFLQAFTLGNDLNRKDTAHALYQAFLKRYPGHELAASAAVLLEERER